ncbi:UDP-N-acetylglucosamine 2-epimerase (non-hydrolyzing) [bacterium]|nr:UDP-N-acetylglucosamine 2-epimerase (non-hydrolyzing) [bacterium]
MGDVNSTLACSLVAAKLQIKLAHIEAGLRSFDRSMPEEINRIVTDVLSDYLFTTCQDANNNLEKEGIGKEKTFFVGNVMIDSLFSNMEGVNNSLILKRLGLEEKIYALLTLHRPSNVDQKETFLRILEAIEEIQKEIKIVFSVHPRTRIRIKELGLDEKIDSLSNMIVVEPLSYLDFLRLTKGSKFTMTDSGGLQEETTVLGIPCVTIRENTERPITISEGTNVLVGTDTEKIVRECLVVINGGGKRGRIPKLWDGKAAKRIVEKLLEVDSLAGR